MIANTGIAASGAIMSNAPKGPPEEACIAGNLLFLGKPLPLTTDPGSPGARSNESRRLGLVRSTSLERSLPVRCRQQSAGRAECSQTDFE